MKISEPQTLKVEFSSPVMKISPETLTFRGVAPPGRAESRWRIALPNRDELLRRVKDLAAADPVQGDVVLNLVDIADEAYRQAMYAADNAEAMAAEAHQKAKLADERAAAMRSQLTANRQAMEAERSALAAELTYLRDRNAKLQAQLAPLQARARKHRNGARSPAPVIRDPEGSRSQRPDPSAAATEEELMECLRNYRKWAGNPSIRQIAAGSDRRISATQVHTLLNEREMPARLEQLDGIIRGCGGTDEDRQAWADAWRVLFAARP